MALTPLLDRVILKPIEADNITKSGIYIPETAKKEKPFIYEVVAVGPGKKDRNGDMIESPVNVGDRVLCGQYSGDEVDLDGDKFKVVAFEYLLAKVG